MTQTILAAKNGVCLTEISMSSNNGIFDTAWSLKTPRLPNAPMQHFRTKIEALKAFDVEVLWCAENHNK